MFEPMILLFGIVFAVMGFLLWWVSVIICSLGQISYQFVNDKEGEHYNKLIDLAIKLSGGNPKPVAHSYYSKQYNSFVDEEGKVVERTAIAVGVSLYISISIFILSLALLFWVITLPIATLVLLLYITRTVKRKTKRLKEKTDEV